MIWSELQRYLALGFLILMTVHQCPSSHMNELLGADIAMISEYGGESDEANHGGGLDCGSKWSGGEVWA